MKRCPECRRDYYDDSLIYCLDDGAALLEGPSSMNEPATAVLPPSRVSSEAATRTFEAGEPTATADVPAAPRRGALVPATIGVVVLAALATGAYFLYARWTSPRIDSIAVLPFVNESGSAEFEYLSDGVTETLINSLSQIPNLSVKGRSSVFRYKGKDVEPQQAASELGVRAILNGRVLQRGDSITLSVDLTDGSTGNQIWGDQYVRKLTDIVALQKEVAKDVAEKLKARLTSAQEQQLAKQHSPDPEAYQLYLQGRFQWNKRTDDGVLKAEQFFQKAIERDPQYALAYVGLADSYIVVDRRPPLEANPKAKAAALKALELDPTLGEAHAVLANTAFYFEWDWPTAEREYKRAMELSPNYATTYHWYGETLAALGRYDESAAQYARARELDPVSLAIATDQGWIYFHSRQFDRAIEHFKAIIETDPTFVRTHYYLAAVYEEKEMFAEAIQERKKALLLAESNPAEIEAGEKQILDAVRTGGAKGYWQTILRFTLQESAEDHKPARSVDLAGIYAKLNDPDKAFEWLDKALEERRSMMVFLKVDPTWDNIRSDPRFAEAVRKVGLP